MAFLLVALFAMNGFGFSTPPDDDLARELPRLAATEPAAALTTFQLHPGFRLLQVAAEPLVADPVSVCFDADQRLYVVDMGDYPFRTETPNGRVRLLEDRDNDGQYETSIIVIDKLAWPTSVVPYDGGVFIAAAPDILFIKDTDGDGVADVRKVVFTGFGIGNVQALVNGLIWGLDGWIYGASGGNGGEIVNPNQPEMKPVSVRGRDFRFKPDGLAFEAIAGGGQFGNTFDDWGHRFVCNNSNHIRQVVIESRYLERNPNISPPPALVDIAAEGPAAKVYRISPAEPWRLVRTRQRAADPDFFKRLPATELVPIGFFTSATGVTIYRGSAFGEEFRGNAFIGDVGGNLIHRKRLEPNGAIYQATRADEGVEFLASTDNWFRPVNFVNTPDGTLLILDMYRETIEHPDSIPDPIKRHLDLTSGKNRGRIYNLVPERFRKRPRLRLSQATNSELVNLLADPDVYWRETAQRLLVEHPDRDTVPMLRSFVESTTSPLGKLHALWTLENLKALLFGNLAAALSDPEPRLRENAARLLEGLVDEEPQAAEALFALAKDPDSLVRFQTALSLGFVKTWPASRALVEIAAATPTDTYLRAAILSGIAGRAVEFTTWAGFDLSEKANGVEWIEALTELEVLESTDRENAKVFLEMIGPLGATKWRRPVLLGFSRGLKRQGRGLADLFRAADTTIPPASIDRAEQDAVSDQPVPQRENAMLILSLAAPGRALAVLTDLIDPRQPDEIQRASIQTLALLESDDVAPALLKRWSSLGPSARGAVITALVERVNWTKTLLDAIASGAVSASELSELQRSLLSTSRDPTLRARASQILGASKNPERANVIARYQSAVENPGDLQRGRELFAKHCASCHRAEGKGVAVAPDIESVSHRSSKELLTHILDPNREVNPSYLVYAVATSDGRTHAGILAEESATSLTLKRANGEGETVRRSEVEDIRSTGLSLMPADLDKSINPSELCDLISFLHGLSEQSK
jgi:putative membrane-bound dehydrogenase-like protein